MTATSKTLVVKDLKEKFVLVSREFDAPLSDVWRAFTEAELLDQWWGPEPWRAETKTMNFTVGGYWLYAMVSPENQKHWGRMNYLAISPHKNIHMEDVFCDENGVASTDLPASKGQTVFTKTTSGTHVEFKMMYPSEADLIKIIEMGFEQGITMCFEQLERLLTSKKI
jgi:uncharacterized protein YndB with AHSA1/START domain